MGAIDYETLEDELLAFDDFQKARGWTQDERMLILHLDGIRKANENRQRNLTDTLSGNSFINNILKKAGVGKNEKE